MLPQACRAPTNLPGSHLPDETASGCITLLNSKGRMQRPFLGAGSMPQFTSFFTLLDPNRGKGAPWPWRTVQAKCSARIFVFGSLLPCLFSLAITACTATAQKLCTLSRWEDKEEPETGQENFFRAGDRYLVSHLLSPALLSLPPAYWSFLIAVCTLHLLNAHSPPTTDLLAAIWIVLPLCLVWLSWLITIFNIYLLDCAGS